MPQTERNRRIDKFIAVAFEPLRASIKALAVEIDIATAEMGMWSKANALVREYNIFFRYEDHVVSEFRTLQIEVSPTPTSVLRIYETAIKETQEAMKCLKASSSAYTLIMENMEKVKDFCTLALTQSQGTKFFETKRFNVEAVKRVNGEILESWESFSKKSVACLLPRSS